MTRQARTSTAMQGSTPASFLLAAQASATVDCRVSYEVQNTSRYVHGPVDEECGVVEANGPPFGNWGVETDAKEREEGDRFQGWCHRRRLCDNEGECKTYCRDDRCEWNSYTSNVARYAPRNPQLYNHRDGWEQASTTGKRNVHGFGKVGIGVFCPVDTDGDHYADSGGCRDLLATGFHISGHKTDLWELDHRRSWDDLVGVLRSPKLSASIRTSDRTVYGCVAGTDGTYRRKKSGNSREAVSAKAAIRTTSARLEGVSGDCCDQLRDPGCRECR